MNFFELRRRRHRIDPSRPIRTARALGAFVEEAGLAFVTGRGDLPSLVEAIAGREIRGSWMADPECHRIYALLGRLDEVGALVAPVVAGKACAVHVALAPAVGRVASDEGRRERTRKDLPARARRLLERVEREGELRMDESGLPTREGRSARQALERALLVVSESLHTDRGSHTAVVRPWRESAFAAHTSRLGFDEAEGAIVEAAVRAGVVVPVRSAARWFEGAAGAIDRLVEEGRVRRVTVEGKEWLAVEPGAS